jgi:Xaa-Pro aminopeptidase
MVALFPGATEQAFNYKSNTFPFRQDSSFLYYFGFSQPGLSGIIDADSGKSILVGNDADIEDVVWMGPQPSMSERIQQTHIRGIAEGVAFANQARLAYQAICTIQGQTLHNNDYHRILKEGDMLLCDIGAENIMGYAGDITRSYPVSPTFSSIQADIYDLVLKAEMTCIEKAKAGVRYLDVHLSAARIIADGLKQIGLMKGDIDEAVAAGAHALFFPHGLGHMIGLDVHDLENLGENNVGYDDTVQRSQQFGTAYLRMARALEPGFVITVEPGIYFIPELIDMWQQEGKHKDFICYDKLDPYRNFTGIRIEDNVLVTTDGPVVLGPPIPKMRSDIER